MVCDHLRYSEFTVRSSYPASEAVAVSLHEVSNGFVVEHDHASVTYKVYFPESLQLDEVERRLHESFAAFPCDLLDQGLPTISRQWIDEEDWAEAWKVFFKPMRVGRRIVIKPQWQPWPPLEDPSAARPDDLIIELDPGMAFGTGSHPTTRLCLRAVEEYVQPGMQVVDLGCGSGILTVAALKLGAARVLAIDNDDLAIEATRANCARNEVQGCELVNNRGLEGIEGDYEAIVANISVTVIRQEIPLAYEFLPPGGLFIASGFYIASSEELIPVMQEQGFEILLSDEEEFWGCIVCRKPV